MGFFSSIGKAIGGTLSFFGGPALGPLGLFAGPIFGTLDGLFGGGSGGGGSSQQGGIAAIPQNTSAGSTINSLNKLSQIPSVIGTMRVSPAAVVPAWTEIADKSDIWVNQIFALQGEHDITDIQLNGVDINTFTSDQLEFEVKPGSDSDTPLTLITKSVFEEILNVTLPDFKFTTNNPHLLVDNTPIEKSRPQFIYAESKSNPDKIHIDLHFPRGFVRASDGTESSTALHLTVGGRNLPNIRMVGRTSGPVRFRITLDFRADPGGNTPANAANDTFPAVIFNRCEIGVNDPTYPDWEADPYFGPHEPGFNSTNSETLHYSASEDTCVFYLDPDDPSNPWPKQKYEIGLRRGFGGITLITTNFDWYHGISNSLSPPSWNIPNTSPRDSAEVSQIVLRSISTERDEHPINATGFALIAIRARNLTINSLSCLASGKTANWNGSDWNTVEATSNPASWLRRFRTDPFLADPLPDSIRDDTDFQELHDFCAAEGLNVNLVAEGGRNIDGDLFEQICSAAYAKKRNGATWGVWIDKDRSGEAPVGVLTPLNAGELTVSKAFDNTKNPEALRVRWRDATNDYAVARERIFYRSGFSAATPNLKIVSVESPGKVTEAEVDEWALRLLAELSARQTFYQCEVDWEALQYEPGDLIALAFDTINRKHGFAVVESVQTSGPNVTGLTFQGELNIETISGFDAWAVANIWTQPNIWGDANIGIGIRYQDGTIVYKAINETADGNSVTFTTPFTTPATLTPGCVVWSGAVASEDRRVYIDSIDGTPDLGARMICVDEAPNIHP